jgi:hypothetical protein
MRGSIIGDPIIVGEAKLEVRFGRRGYQSNWRGLAIGLSRAAAERQGLRPSFARL